MSILTSTAASLATKEPQTTPTPEQTADADSAKTTIGEGKSPRLVEELKETVRGGVQVGGAIYGTSSITTPISMAKLNPSAPVFTPAFTTSSSTTSSAMPHPIYTKYSIPATTSSSSTTSTSRLDPTSKEFVPSGHSLAATNLSPEINGNPNLYGNGDVIPEEDYGYLDVKSIVRGFERAAPTDPKDPSGDPILSGAAEMLLKVYNYPASFDELGKNFQTTLSSWKPSESTLINLAEMLVHWVSVCVCCHVMCHMVHCVQ